MRLNMMLKAQSDAELLQKPLLGTLAVPLLQPRFLKRPSIRKWYIGSKKLSKATGKRVNISSILALSTLAATLSRDSFQWVLPTKIKQKARKQDNLDRQF